MGQMTSIPIFSVRHLGLKTAAVLTFAPDEDPSVLEAIQALDLPTLNGEPSCSPKPTSEAGVPDSAVPVTVTSAALVPAAVPATVSAPVAPDVPPTSGRKVDVPATLLPVTSQDIKGAGGVDRDPPNSTSLHVADRPLRHLA